MFVYARTLTFNMMLVVKVTDALSFREPYINTTYSFQAEDKDEVTDEDVSEASLYDTAEEDEMTEEEVSAASLSGRKRKMRSPTRRWRSQKPRCLKQKWRSQNTSRINNPSVYIISVSEVTIQSILI